MAAPLISQIGSWLKRARVAQSRFSQEQAAVALGVTARTLGSWERGRVAPPADVLFRAANLYGADIASLLDVVAPSGAPDVNQDDDR